MTQLRIFFMATLLLTACHQGARADTVRAQAPNDDWYGQSLDWTIEEYPQLANVPKSRILWLAGRYGRTPTQVEADLKRQAQPTRPVLMTPPGEPAAGYTPIPPYTWDRDAVLDPSYARVLDDAITKYGGVAFVPEESVVWLARTWHRRVRQVKFDLQRVQRADVDNMKKEGFAH